MSRRGVGRKSSCRAGSSPISRASLPHWGPSYRDSIATRLPSVVHDYLYWAQTCTREEADRIFLKAMGQMHVSGLIRYAFYRAVSSKFGLGAWKQNSADRRAGLPRIVPLDAIRRPEPLESWAEYRAFLIASGVRPQTPTPGVASCR